MPRKASTTSASSRSHNPPYQDSTSSRYASLSSASAAAHGAFEGSDTKLLAAAIDAVIDEGDALIFGRTRDGGAVCVTVLTGTDRIKAYAASQDELDTLVVDLHAASQR